MLNNWSEPILTETWYLNHPFRVKECREKPDPVTKQALKSLTMKTQYSNEHINHRFGDSTAFNSWVQVWAITADLFDCQNSNGLGFGDIL